MDYGSSTNRYGVYNLDDKKDFLDMYNLDEPGLYKLISLAYNHLGLITFFTAGVKEIRAWTVAKNAVEKALQYSYIHRRTKKREIRSLWIQRINAAVREGGMSYSEFIGKLKKSNINLNRKVLADIAMNDPDSFKQILKSVS